MPAGGRGGFSASAGRRGTASRRLIPSRPVPSSTTGCWGCSGGVAPTVRELADHLNYRSPSPARRLLMGLEERGFIRRLPAKDRAIEVVKPVSRFEVFRFDFKSKSLHRQGDISLSTACE